MIGCEMGVVVVVVMKQIACLRSLLTLDPVAVISFVYSRTIFLIFSL